MDETRIGEQRHDPTTADASIGILLADFDRHLEVRHGCAEGTRKTIKGKPRPSCSAYFQRNQLTGENWPVDRLLIMWLTQQEVRVSQAR